MAQTMKRDIVIRQPPPTPMQAGRGGRGAKWVIEYEYDASRSPEPLMGWTASDSTLNQVRIPFDSKEDAIAFADKKGWSYMLVPAQTRKIIPRNYVDNFIYRSPEDR